jgi:hypothetical protein
MRILRNRPDARRRDNVAIELDGNAPSGGRLK